MFQTGRLKNPDTSKQAYGSGEKDGSGHGKEHRLNLNTPLKFVQAVNPSPDASSVEQTWKER
jgi:hypothetical protein